MGKKSRIVIGAVLVTLLFASADAQAELCRVQFDARIVRTTDDNNTVSTAMEFVVEAWDTERKNPPDFVQSITVTAPDNSTFQMGSLQYWYPYSGARYYDVLISPDQFKSGNIVGGTYWCTVKDVNGKSVKSKDTVALTLLQPPQIIEPGEGSTVTDPLKVKWTAVRGAARYRIILWNNTTNEPVFWLWQDQLYVTGTEITLPTGSLKPSCNYRILVDARSELLDTDTRAKSKWVPFNTGP